MKGKALHIIIIATVSLVAIFLVIKYVVPFLSSSAPAANTTSNTTTKKAENTPANSLATLLGGGASTSGAKSYMGYTLAISSQPNYNINNDSETMSVLKDYLNNPTTTNNQGQSDYDALNKLGTWNPALPIITTPDNAYSNLMS